MTLYAHSFLLPVFSLRHLPVGRLWIVACLFVAVSVSLRAQPYAVTSWSLPDGLPQSQVFALCQDYRGYLWLGTQGGGLSRFDGLGFETHTTAEGLPSNYVNALFEDSAHRLWVGTNQGLCRYDGRRFERISMGGVEVYALAQVQENTVWIGTDRGVFACSGADKTARAIPLPGNGAPPLATAICPSDNGVWVGTNRGAWLLGSANLHLGEKEGLPGAAVVAIARDARGQAWIATVGGVLVFDEKSRRVTRVFRDAPLTRVLSLQAEPDGSMWMGTSSEGLVLYQVADSALIRLTERDGLPHPHVRALRRDNAGQLWAGTSGGGVARIGRQPFRHFDQTRGLAGNRVYALHEDRAGRLWLGVSQNGLQWLDSAGFHPFTRDSGFLNIKCKTIAEDATGNLWVGTEGKGIAMFDSAGMHVLDRRRGLPGDLVQKIVPGSSGEMWVALLSGGIARVTRAAGGAFEVQAFGLREGLSNGPVQTLATDAKGRICFATQAGQVGFLDSRKVSAVWYTPDGLPGAPVRSLAFDAQGRLWAGTKGAGIFWTDPSEKQPVFQKLAGSPQNVYLLTFDAAGHLWAGSENGVDKIVFKGGNSAAVSTVQHYGKTEGFLGIETCQDAVLEDRAGRLWFGTMNGLTQYVPSRQTRTPVAPVLHLEAISLFYKPLAETAYAGWVLPDGGLRDGLQLPYFQNHLSFAFRAVDLSRPETIRYRWRLEGAETEWSPWSAQQQVNYAKLAPGLYTFLVQATSDGQTFSKPLQVSFTVRKPLWQHWWFQGLVFLLLTALIALAALAWVRRIRRAEQARREQLEVQNRLLQLEQKALQLQMNPHFIFNALTSIQALLTEKDYPQARQEISHFAKLMRSILANSRRPVISLREEADTLEQYLRIEQFCLQQKFDFHIELPENLDPEEVELPPMLLQPFVENAVVHGVSPLPYPGHIAIQFSLGSDLLTCTISDNGIGRERAARLREGKKPGHQSAALQVTQERLDALRGERDYVPLEISDILDGEGNIAGTRVVVRLPVEEGFH